MISKKKIEKILKQKMSDLFLNKKDLNSVVTIDQFIAKVWMRCSSYEKNDYSPEIIVKTAEELCNELGLAAVERKEIKQAFTDREQAEKYLDDVQDAVDSATLGLNNIKTREDIPCTSIEKQPMHLHEIMNNLDSMYSEAFKHRGQYQKYILKSYEHSFGSDLMEFEFIKDLNTELLDLCDHRDVIQITDFLYTMQVPSDPFFKTKNVEELKEKCAEEALKKMDAIVRNKVFDLGLQPLLLEEYERFAQTLVTRQKQDLKMEQVELEFKNLNHVFYGNILKIITKYKKDQKMKQKEIMPSDFGFSDLEKDIKNSDNKIEVCEEATFRALDETVVLNNVEKIKILKEKPVTFVEPSTFKKLASLPELPKASEKTIKPVVKEDVTSLFALFRDKSLNELIFDCQEENKLIIDKILTYYQLCFGDKFEKKEASDFIATILVLIKHLDINKFNTKTLATKACIVCGSEFVPEGIKMTRLCKHCQQAHLLTRLEATENEVDWEDEDAFDFTPRDIRRVRKNKCYLEEVK